jgi:hypothetical protein
MSSQERRLIELSEAKEIGIKEINQFFETLNFNKVLNNNNENFE